MLKKICGLQIISCTNMGQNISLHQTVDWTSRGPPSGGLGVVVLCAVLGGSSTASPFSSAISVAATYLDVLARLEVVANVLADSLPKLLSPHVLNKPHEASLLPVRHSLSIVPAKEVSE